MSMEPSLTHIRAGLGEERGIPPGLCPSRKGGSILNGLAPRSQGKSMWELVVPCQGCWQPC